MLGVAVPVGQPDALVGHGLECGGAVQVVREKHVPRANEERVHVKLDPRRKVERVKVVGLVIEQRDGVHNVVERVLDVGRRRSPPRCFVINNVHAVQLLGLAFQRKRNGAGMRVGVGGHDHKVVGLGFQVEHVVIVQFLQHSARRRHARRRILAGLDVVLEERCKDNAKFAENKGWRVPALAHAHARRRHRAVDVLQVRDGVALHAGKVRAVLYFFLVRVGIHFFFNK